MAVDRRSEEDGDASLLLRRCKDEVAVVAAASMPACPASELRSRSNSSTRRPISSNLDMMEEVIMAKRRSCKRNMSKKVDETEFKREAVGITMQRRAIESSPFAPKDRRQRHSSLPCCQEKASLRK